MICCKMSRAWLAPPGAVWLNASNQRLICAGDIRSNGFDPNAGKSCLARTYRTPCCVDGLYRLKWAFFHASATKPRNDGTERPISSGSRSLPGAADRTWHSRRTCSTVFSITGPSVILRVPPPVLSRKIQLLPPDGRTRTPRPGRRPSQTVYSRSRGRRRAMAASVSRTCFSRATAQPSSTAPTVSAASWTIVSARCVYLSVVSGLRCPSSFPIARMVLPCLSARLACVCRKS